MRIQVLTETDDTNLRDIGTFWTIGPEVKADVNSRLRGLLNYSASGWVLTPLQAVTVDGKPYEARSEIILQNKTVVKSGKNRIVLTPL